MFDVSSSKKKFNANNIYIDGCYPYVVRTSENNGIRGFINEDTKFLNNGKTISFGQDTATIFYQETPYFTGDKIKILSPKFCISIQLAMYMISCMRKSFSNFQWGVSSFNESIIKSIKIKLPISQNGDIDYDFMETFIQKMEQTHIQEMDAYLKAIGFDDCKLTEEEKNTIKSLSNKKFIDFEIGLLFDINTGRDVIIGRIEDGTIPLISHQHDNNGISKRIKQLNYRILFDHTKTISLADRGVFYATTQAEDFHIGTRVKALTFKDGMHEETIRLFFVTAINKLQILFKDYLVNATDKLPYLKIKLPVTSTGDIDYKFMEVYIRAQEKLAIQRIKDWQEK